MLTLIIAITAAGGVFSGAYFAGDFGLGWSITLGVLAFVASNFALGFALQRKAKVVMDRVQGIMGAGQKRLEAKMQRWQMRPPGSIQAAQKEIFEDTKVFVKDALAATEDLRRYRLWIPMVDRQIATAQLQLNWMIKDFRKVDQLLPKAILIDPTMVAMKLARMQMLNADLAEIEKVYRKGVRRLKYNQNALIAATYSWILVRREKIDEAFKTLTEALKSSDNETLKRNHELLMNNRVAHFNNSGLGDQWYSLHLEEPKVSRQRQHVQYR